MSISLRLTDEETKLIRKYAELHGLSVSELIREAVMEKIETEYDISAFEKAMDEYRRDPVSYTLDDAEKELGLS